MHNSHKTRHGYWAQGKRTLRYWYLRVFRQNASPKNIALGLALGVFVGALPIIPFQTVTILPLAFLFRTNKLSAWLATCYSNLITLVPFYTFLFFVGKTVLPVKNIHFAKNKLEMLQLIETGWDVFLVMLTGGFIFGIVAGIFTYFIALQAITRFRRLRRERRKNRHNKTRSL